MSCHCIIIPFVTFSIVLCLWCPFWTCRDLINSKTRLFPFLLLEILVYYRYVSLWITFFYVLYIFYSSLSLVSFLDCIIIPFITFSIVLCLWCPFWTCRDLINSETRLLPFLLLVCFISNKISFMSFHCIIMPFVIFSIVLCLWCRLYALRISRNSWLSRVCFISNLMSSGWY